MYVWRLDNTMVTLSFNRWLIIGKGLFDLRGWGGVTITGGTCNACYCTYYTYGQGRLSKGTTCCIIKLLRSLVKQYINLFDLIWSFIIFSCLVKKPYFPIIDLIWRQVFLLCFWACFSIVSCFLICLNLYFHKTNFLVDLHIYPYQN